MAGAPLARSVDAIGRERRAVVLERIRELGLADSAAIARAELVGSKTGQPIEQVLNQLGSLSDDDLVAVYADVAGCEIWEPERQPIMIELDGIGVSTDYLRRSRIAVVGTPKGGLICAVCDPFDDQAFSGLVFATGRKVSILVARPTEWRGAFDAAYSDAERVSAPTDARRLEREIELVADSASEGAGARLVASAFEAAIAQNASDIHFEPRRNDLLIRLRVDGRLVEHRVASADLSAPAVARVKVIAGLDLGEKRLPQDGRTTFVIGGRQVDVRVATSPTVFGESAVLRILDRANVALDFASLGISDNIAELLRSAARSPHGMFLITGPTGSGKTTTLYALLQTFAGSAKKVLSVEDPVEYHFEHVSQTQVAPQVGLTFAGALRSFLRQDPDVILVGEIRDPETAAVAVQAAMTGHFVLASVHANSALAVAPRLKDMGVEPYQLVAGLRGAAAQRLVRRLCPECRSWRAPEETERALFVEASLPVPGQIASSVGCAHCKGLGFKGRVAIAEAFLADEEICRALGSRSEDSQFDALVRARGFAPMLVDGLSKAAEGVTTVDEVVTALHG